MGGPGLNLGLQDAVNLGWKLAAVLDGRVDPASARHLRGRAPARRRAGHHAQPRPAGPGPARARGHRPAGTLLRAGHRSRRRPSPRATCCPGAENRYAQARDAHPLAGHWVPDFAVAERRGNPTALRSSPATDGHCWSISPRAEWWRPRWPIRRPDHRRRGTPGRRRGGHGPAGASGWLCGVGVVGGRTRGYRGTAWCARAVVRDREPLLRVEFVLVLLGHVLDGLILRLREAFARLAGARGGIQRRLRLTLEMRHHFGGEQFG